MRVTAPLYALYARRLRKQLAGTGLPGHVGLIMDGNRRWARQQSLANPSLGHRYGAAHAERVLSWCESLGIRYVTVFLCSTENLTNRADGEVAFLIGGLQRVGGTTRSGGMGEDVRYARWLRRIYLQAAVWPAP
ncbi:undecaprenyl diphosphate synthase family protein [Amycolatopsis sp. NBC_00355]|uniref:undecaprenyl diphosphate synthase family protein n=1 Tax=Amycolatopsis sp. NBC_00355 TaxID=2975957 RepID=UPI002E25E562